MASDPIDTPLAQDRISLRREAMRADTLRAIKTRRTAVARWKSLPTLTTDPLWIERAQAAVAFIPDGCHVLDIGCGDMQLEARLPTGCRYTPLDVVRRDKRTVLADLNRVALPVTDADFVVGLGLLEYLFDLPTFLGQVAAQFSRGLFSYHPLERSPRKDRLSVGWVNALNSPELLALFRHAGFSSITVHEYKPALHFYCIARD